MRTTGAVLIGLSVLGVLLSGCGTSSANLRLQHAADQTGRYKATTAVIKDFRFEQPNLEKLREEQTKNYIEMDFTQQVLGIDANGNATARITIDALKVEVINKNDPRLIFNSVSEADKNSPMQRLIGASYTISIDPQGTAAALDLQDARRAVTGGYEKTIADSILNEKNIAERHTIAALPPRDMEKPAVRSSWSQVVASPPGLLAPKSYRKTYVLSGIEGNIATVDMTAVESGESAGSLGNASAMGFFAKMFDNEDAYSGQMKLNLETGRVVYCQEALVSSYIASEMPANADPDKGPDTLTMRFTHLHRIESLD